MIGGTMFVILAFVATLDSGPGLPGRDLQRLASEARTADLRGDWSGLMRAHDAIAHLPPGARRAWIDYYLGYTDWRESALASMGQGRPAAVACLQNAQDHLTRALEAAPGFTEARLLLVIVDGGVLNADASRVADLGPRLLANTKQVAAEAPENP